MLPEKRRNLITWWIYRHGAVSIEELVKQLDVSKTTIWRDLKILEDSGVVRKVHGGALSINHEQLHGLQHEFKLSICLEQKQKIASFAARNLVDEGDIIILDSGTTVIQMVYYFNQSKLTILTNGHNAMDKLLEPQRQHIRAISSGGILKHNSATYVGPDTESFFSRFKADKFFLSGAGFTLDKGLTDEDPLEIQAKQVMHKTAKKTIVLLDASKMTQSSLSTVLEINEIDLLVTDSDAPPDFVKHIQDAGMDVKIANDD